MAKKKNVTEVVEENEIATWTEEKLGALKPYASQIALACALAFAAFVGFTYWQAYKTDAVANQWRDLNVSRTDAMISGNASSLVEVYDQHPDSKAGLWSLQMAGDVDMQLGLRQMVSDREMGRKQVEKAKANFQKVVDAPAARKSPELAERSRFALAYACESLGEFDDAKSYYDAFSDNADSIFFEPAMSGAKRCSNPSLIAVYKKFDEHDPGDAPGALVPNRPSLEVPEFDLDNLPQPNAGGGDFGTDIGDEEAPEIAPGINAPGIDAPGIDAPGIDAPESPDDDAAPAPPTGDAPDIFENTDEENSDG